MASGRLHYRVKVGYERQVFGYHDVANRVLTAVRPFYELRILRIEEDGFESDSFADIAGNLILFSLGPIIDLDITAPTIGVTYLDRYRSLCPSVKLTLDQNFSRLLTGGGVDVEVLEEDLRVAGGRSAALGLVVRLDVDGGGHRSERRTKGSGLAVGTGDAVALGLGSLDDEFEVGDVGRNRCQDRVRV